MTHRVQRRYQPPLRGFDNSKGNFGKTEKYLFSRNQKETKKDATLKQSKPIPTPSQIKLYQETTARKLFQEAFHTPNGRALLLSELPQRNITIVAQSGPYAVAMLQPTSNLQCFLQVCLIQGQGENTIIACDDSQCPKCPSILNTFVANNPDITAKQIERLMADFECGVQLEAKQMLDTATRNATMRVSFELKGNMQEGNFTLSALGEGFDFASTQALNQTQPDALLGPACVLPPINSGSDGVNKYYFAFLVLVVLPIGLGIWKRQQLRTFVKGRCGSGVTPIVIQQEPLLTRTSGTPNDN